MASFCMQDFILEVKVTAGDMHLGSEDFAYQGADFCMQVFERKSRGIEFAGWPELDDNVIEAKRDSPGVTALSAIAGGFAALSCHAG